MLFSQPVFFLFLVAVVGFLFFVKNNRVRKLFLLCASYYFYAYWDYRFCSLLLISTIVDFYIGQGLKQTESPGKRRFLLSVSLACNLGMLGFFKYCNFFIESMEVLLEPLGWHVHTLDIILPVGISFYTFQTLSYTIDVYNKKLSVCDDFWDFALFVSFFPQLVAGPIVRAAEFLPQLAEHRPLSHGRFFWGFQQFVRGLVKKVLIADHLAMVSDVTFNNIGLLDGYSTWVGVLCYTGQIYCDFSGYTDMAIGVAKIIGYDFCPNFNHPYVATSVSDFWRRWHISLSTWLRDYLYIPLGGNRKGPRRTYINLVLTMLLGGLWHGAAWTFVFWGLWHGLALSLCKLITTKYQKTEIHLLGKLLGWSSTMLVVIIGWVFFRSDSIESAFQCVLRMFSFYDFSEGVHWIPLQATICLPTLILFHAISITKWKERVLLRPESWFTPIILFLLVYLVLLFRSTSFEPFIYFQF